MEVLKVALLTLVYLIAATGLFASDRIDGIKFSGAEIGLLKRLNQIEAGAGISATMLKAAPFVQLFGSPAPTDMAITITTNDWDLIIGSLNSLKKIESCKLVEAIDFWTDVDGNQYSSTKTEEFFRALRSKGNRGC